MTTQENTKPFAEIVESSLSTWKAQCWDWDNMPAYGSLVTVKTSSRTLYGLVYEIQTSSSDNARTVFTYKKSEEELRRDHPHIFEFLQTTFTCLTLGYSEDELLFYQVAPEPPKIHAFVHRASQMHIEKFFSHEQYLHLLFAYAHQVVSCDELLLAILKQLTRSGIITSDNFARFIETFSLLTGNDYRRLKLFLQRAQTIVNFASPLIAATLAPEHEDQTRM